MCGAQYRCSLLLPPWLPWGGRKPGHSMEALLQLMSCSVQNTTSHCMYCTDNLHSSDLSLQNAQDITSWGYLLRLWGLFKCFSQPQGCERKELTETETGIQSIYMFIDGWNNRSISLSLSPSPQAGTSQESVLRNCIVLAEMGAIQRRLASPLLKDDMQIREEFHINRKIKKKLYIQGHKKKISFF